MRLHKVLFLFWCVGLLMPASAQTATTKHLTKKTATPAVTQADLQVLRDALAAQQEQIRQLADQLKQRDAALLKAQQQVQATQASVTETQTKAAASESMAKRADVEITQVATDLQTVEASQASAANETKEGQKRLAALETTLGRFRWAGDVRVRGDSTFQNYSGCAACIARNRAQLRLRLGVEGPINQDFTAGIFMASGAVVNGAPSFTNPISANETLSSNFERKTVGFDRGYIIYNPQHAKWLKLTGGKFLYDWTHTDLTFDPDLNPEGFTQRMSWDFKNAVLKNVYLEGMQLLYNEVAGGPAGTAVNRGADSNALGGSFGAKLRLTHWWSATPSFTILNWNGADEIAQATLPVGLCATPTSQGCILEPNVPPVGTPMPVPVTAPVVTLNGNAMTNATRIVGTGTGQRRAFVSGFEYADFILDNNFLTPWKRLPLRVTAEYEQNLRAQLNVGLAPSVQDKAYWFEINLGQQKQKHDLQFGYSWWRIEQDAVISQFNESEQRAPTNVLQNRFYVNWLVQPNVTASFTDWIGRTLNRNLQNAALAPGLPSNMNDPYVNRLQFDLIYKF
jgi:hypothetical protein